MIPVSSAEDSLQTLYKMIILYILDRVDFPITRVQVADFMQKKGYLSYLAVQSIFSKLSEAGLITQEKKLNKTILSITDEGRETLSLFQNEITAEIKKDINEYLRSNAMSLREKTAAGADYIKSADGGYSVNLSLSEHGNTILDISVSMPTEELAKSACEKWQSCHEEIYSSVMSYLLG